MHRLFPVVLATAVVASTALGGGCRLPVGLERKPGTAPRCENGICVEVVSFYTNRHTIGAWIDTPPATRLVNARVAADDIPACQGHFFTEWVNVDGGVYRKGPVDISGAHGVVFGFPIHTWLQHAGLLRDMFIDVELDVAGTPRCFRTRLTSDDGKEAVGS